MTSLSDLPPTEREKAKRDYLASALRQELDRASVALSPEEFTQCVERACDDPRWRGLIRCDLDVDGQRETFDFVLRRVAASANPVRSLGQVLSP